jgi:hypothetical protein
MHAAKMATIPSLEGKATAGLGILAVGYDYYNSDQSGADYARLAGAGVITATALIPFVGPLISIGLGAADAYGGFDGVYKYFD